MPAVKVVDFNGQDAGEMNLSDAVFAAPVHIPAMHQVVVAHLANCRQGTHSTKTRGEVRGGGKKPWKQKHTGRARQGSTRSPIWVHGGVAHGPKPRDYHQKVNRKVRRLAMKSALSVKVRDELMTVVKGMEMDKPSTKAMKNFMEAIGAEKALVVCHTSADSVMRSVRNIPGAKFINIASINVYDLMNSKALVVTPEVVARLEEVYAR
ncbi:MAG: 50S ribosomal protein L4 [Fretibacterium sp.]|uniref:50S ribosomal protein L4 n=1 Tax=Fretibacterium sp. OH1220_COT-178 TaxID=2491047 RepID=UPI000F5E02E2|nr:50S ribosomal protein L4 [Fretibacterium sp. OH1220_COT-178]MDO4786334.1 50S ribosomal protein L4 [Fretibacterium sp.]RRD64322.1 50S ribosomal protein L4 [Fretibacterium sp. OH1220_COT-178]